MSRAARRLVIAAVVLAAPAAACTVLLGAGDVPTPADAGDATVETGPGGHDGGGDAVPSESGGDSGGGDAGTDAVVEACAPTSSTRCEGKQPEVCGANGQWREAGAACEYICDDGGCTGQCTPTTKQCVGLDPETCTAEGLWEAGAACPYLCEGGTCTGSCTPNTVQCGTAPVGDAGATTGSVNTCDSTGLLHVAPCGQPTPDCTEAGAPSCACTGSMCGSVCAHLQTDPGNCGTCGHDCLGGACVAGACQPFALASNQQDPYDLAIDGTNVYWVDNTSTGTVNACALTGCNNTPTVLATGQNGPTGITVGGSVAYWVNIGVGVNGGSVMSCATTGCANQPTPLATNLNSPTAIAVATDGNAYWTGSSGTMKCAIASCTPAAFGPGGSDIVVDGTNAYWTATGGPVRCALGGCGGTPTAISTGQLSPWAMAVDGNNVYWTNLSGHTVTFCAIGGGCGGNPHRGFARDAAQRCRRRRHQRLLGGLHRRHRLQLRDRRVLQQTHHSRVRPDEPQRPGRRQHGHLLGQREPGRGDEARQVGLPLKVDRLT